MKGKMRFIGNGSAFNTELGCNSGYIANGSSLIIFDCGGDVFGRLRKMRVLTEDIKDITVFITHIHPDHVGSLGDLIYYSHYIAKLDDKIRVVSTDRNLSTLLKLLGVKDEQYHSVIIGENFKYSMHSKDIGVIEYEALEVRHSSQLKSSGYIITLDDTILYYSGDSCEVPKQVVDKLIDNRINEVYQDTCNMDYEGNPHLFIGKLADTIPVEHRHKVFCMHLDESMYSNKDKIEQIGFNRTVNDFEILEDICKEKTVVYAGSFDPITEGHREMIAKASKMFDNVVVGVLVNNKKNPVFSMEERVKLVEKCVSKYSNVQVKQFKGALVDFAKQNNSQFIVKGLRSVSDFESEIQMAMINKQLKPDIETVLLVPDMKHQYISSSVVRELASLKADISWIVPNEIIEDVKNKFGY